MSRIFRGFAALLLFLASSFANAGTATFKFGGEHFVQKFEVKGRAPNAQIEFGLAFEPLKEWTKLVTLHSFVNNGNDAKRAAASLANLVRERYKGAKYELITNAVTGEAIIDFLIPVPNSEFLEFNVFKYAPAMSWLPSSSRSASSSARSMPRSFAIFASTPERR